MLGGPRNSTEGGVLLNVWGGSRSISYWVTHIQHRTQSHPLVGLARPPALVAWKVGSVHPAQRTPRPTSIPSAAAGGSDRDPGS